MAKLRMFFLVLIILLLIIFAYFFIGKAPESEKITWGVVFSQKHSQELALDWQENYLALLDDLKVKDIKLITHWDLIEKDPDHFDFEDLDWQIKEAEKRGVRIILVVGLKTGRWPECHIPNWAKKLKTEDLKERVLSLIEKIVSRYKNSTTIFAWQVENEPFFPFGKCPTRISKDFVKKEIELVKSLDVYHRQVIISDSGELSLWFTAANLGDLVASTLHRKVWFKEFHSYISYPFRPVYYWRKAQIVNKLFNKEVICGELQAEPWGPDLLYSLSLEEQEKTMDLGQFKKNIEFAKKTGLKKFYLWGSEWWYWLKTKYNNSQIWNEARNLF